MGLVTADKNSKTDEAEQDNGFAEGQTVIEDDESKVTGRQPLLLEGTRVKVTGGEHDGRMGSVTRVSFANADESAKFHNAFGEERMLAKVDHYIIRTRDSRNEVLQISPEHLSPLSVTDGWSRGEAPDGR